MPLMPTCAGRAVASFRLHDLQEMPDFIGFPL